MSWQPLVFPFEKKSLQYNTIIYAPFFAVDRKRQSDYGTHMKGRPYMLQGVPYLRKITPNLPLKSQFLHGTVPAHSSVSPTNTRRHDFPAYHEDVHLQEVRLSVWMRQAQDLQSLQQNFDQRATRSLLPRRPTRTHRRQCRAYICLPCRPRPGCMLQYPLQMEAWLDATWRLPRGQELAQGERCRV